MENQFEKNLQVLVIKISNKIGYYISNTETAKEILYKYSESHTRQISRLYYNSVGGMVNAKITFK